MPYYYQVIAQFARANPPSFYTEGYEKFLLEAKEHFNTKSRLAANPKEIIELSIIDSETIRIIFSSLDELQISQISRSLRVFSMYLIDEQHPINFSNLITSKRLFRMSASSYDNVDLEKANVDETEMSDDQLLITIAKLIYSPTNSSARQTINQIKNLLNGGK